MNRNEASKLFSEFVGMFEYEKDIKFKTGCLKKWEYK